MRNGGLRESCNSELHAIVSHVKNRKSNRVSGPVVKEDPLIEENGGGVS